MISDSIYKQIYYKCCLIFLKQVIVILCRSDDEWLAEMLPHLVALCRGGLVAGVGRGGGWRGLAWGWRLGIGARILVHVGHVGIYQGERHTFTWHILE